MHVPHFSHQSTGGYKPCSSCVISSPVRIYFYRKAPGALGVKPRKRRWQHLAPSWGSNFLGATDGCHEKIRVHPENPTQKLNFYSHILYSAKNMRIRDTVRQVMTAKNSRLRADWLARPDFSKITLPVVLQDWLKLKPFRCSRKCSQRLPRSRFSCP